MRCPACGFEREWCQGHPLFDDPTGWLVLRLHGRGHHHKCDPDGCGHTPIWARRG